MASFTDIFHKFPRTPHFFTLPGTSVRGDRLLEPTEAARLMRLPAAVEEKVDGANLGFSVGPDGRVRAQSRGHYLKPGTPGQWRPLWRWLARREEPLREGLGADLLVFGEWCYARHTVAYDALPDWFIAFDVYDRRARQFFSRGQRDALLESFGLATVPLLAEGVFDRKALVKLLGRSRLSSSPAEGLYLRWDEGDRLVARAKVVRPGWVPAGDEHWSKHPLETNRLAAAHGALNPRAARASTPGSSRPG